jgi:large subunit ribosomal protein LP0
MGKDKEISERKQAYRAKLDNLLDTYKSILIVTADNVGSNQMQKIRIAIRGKGVLLMGKNTIMRKVIREKIASQPKFEKLLPQIVGNIGFVFTNGDLNTLRKQIEEHKVPAAARVGTLAPGDCWVPAGPTGLDPGQTGFFQALNIATKIVKGSVEIITDVHLIKPGQKVTPSHVSLLSKLDIKPFFYRMNVTHIFDDGTVFAAEILDKSHEDLLKQFFNGVAIVTALSLRIGVPNLATIPHSIARAFQSLLGIALATDITFKQAQPFKEYLADPAGYAAKHGISSAPAASAPSSSSAPAAKKEEPKKQEEPEEEEDVAINLFGDD